MLNAISNLYDIPASQYVDDGKGQARFKNDRGEFTMNYNKKNWIKV